MRKLGACSTCSVASAAGERFCSDCGQATDGVVLMNVARSVPATTVVSKGADSSGRWLGALGVVLALVIGWSLLTPETVESASDPAGEDAADQGGADQDDVDQGDADQDDAGDDDADQRSAEPVDDVDGGDEAATSAGSGASADPFAAVNGTRTVWADIDVGSFGRNPGDLWTGFVGSGLSVALGDPLRVVDLETGRIREADLDAVPLLAVDDDLVVQSSSGPGRLSALPLSDFGGYEVSFGRVSGFVFHVSMGPAPGSVVVLSNDFNGESERYVESVIDVSSGVVLEEREIDSSSIISAMFGGRFFSPRAGGIYEQDGERSRLVSDGRLVAEGDSIVLVETCDGELACSMSWRDATTFEPVDLALPANLSDGFVVANDRLLVHNTTSQWRFAIFDLETGRQLADGLEFESVLPVSVGPSGDFVAFTENGRGIVLEIETGESIEIGDGLTATPPVLIETP